jgi:hypothetical protein
LIRHSAIKTGHLSVIACAVALTVAIPGPRASGEAANTTRPKTPPSYIEADRSDADQVLGPAIADDVFSDRFTALRKQLVARSLRGNPAPGCAEPPVFTLEVVSPEKPTPQGSAWEETYAITCKQRVRRTFLLFLSAKDAINDTELAPGDTIADAILQRDFLQSATAVAMSRARAGCKGAQVRNTRVTSATGASQPWTEVWSMEACGTSVEVNVTFTPSPNGGVDWSIVLPPPPRR